jgi:hypothetical protein
MIAKARSRVCDQAVDMAGKCASFAAPDSTLGRCHSAMPIVQCDRGENTTSTDIAGSPTVDRRG